MVSSLGFATGIVGNGYGRDCLACDSDLDMVRYLGDGISDRAYFRCSGCGMWYDLPLNHEEKVERDRNAPMARGI